VACSINEYGTGAALMRACYQRVVTAVERSFSGSEPLTLTDGARVLARSLDAPPTSLLGRRSVVDGSVAPNICLRERSLCGTKSEGTEASPKSLAQRWRFTASRLIQPSVHSTARSASPSLHLVATVAHCWRDLEQRHSIRTRSRNSGCLGAFGTRMSPEVPCLACRLSHLNFVAKVTTHRDVLR
jgi:hypothetical protein